MKNLGFGMMRLPVLNGEETNFDYEQLNKMVDTFLEARYNYFDTSYVYHNGKSEEATRRALVERHPRDSFRIATKFPSFIPMTEAEVEKTFAEQLANVGVDYFDYYLLHNLQTVWYDGIEGKGDGLFLSEHLFDHARAWKEEGKIKHLGISFHSSPALLDRVLNNHPEIEFVQIALNPIDWDSDFVAAKKCYEIIRKHGKDVIVMEAVKGGALASLPHEAEKVLKDVCPDKSIASWSIRFASDLEGVIAVLSGMSTIEQVEDNCRTANEAEPLSEKETDALWKAMDIYRNCTPFPPAELEKYRGLTWNGVSVYSILQAYSICLVQPNQAVVDDNNYFKNLLAEISHLDIHADLPKHEVIRSDGMNATYLVEEAVAYLKRNTF
ncbi:MAG: aldo/keto reductase [Mogibacterium sp.]|nr:aldo/keto reductase [Mogibacterium sp.]